MTIRYRVDLSEAERSELKALLRGGRRAARTLKRAQILLAADAGMPDETIAQSLGVGGSTVYRTKRRSAPGPPASSPPRRKRCWSRPPAPARPRAGRGGPSNCSPARSCA
jgi:Homeodomain-like domain-containing protein